MKFLKLLSLVMAVAPSLLLHTGCATIIKGTHQQVPVSSSPSGAVVKIDGQRQGSTPLNVSLARKKPHVVTLEMDGYETENITLTPSMGGAVAGNLIAGGLIGWGVDAGTGAQYNLHPEKIDLRLRKLEEPVQVNAARRSGIKDLLSELERLEEGRKSGTFTKEEYASVRAALLQSFQP